MQNEETDSALDDEDDVDKFSDDIEDDDTSGPGSMIPETVIKFADGMLAGLPPRYEKSKSGRSNKYLNIACLL